jgi:hypothetical protein
MKLDYFSRDIFEKKIPLIQNSIKIRPVGAELSYADGRTDRHDEANFRNCGNASKKNIPTVKSSVTSKVCQPRCVLKD